MLGAAFGTQMLLFLKEKEINIRQNGNSAQLLLGFVQNINQTTNYISICVTMRDMGNATDIYLSLKNIFDV